MPPGGGFFMPGNLCQACHAIEKVSRVPLFCGNIYSATNKNCQKQGTLLIWE
jgi:hypothetical protein